MSRTLIPANIRPHLVPFLFMEFPGIEASFRGKKVKAVKISTRNSLGKIIRFLAEKSDHPQGCDTTNSIFLSIKNQQREKEYFGKIYTYQDGRSNFLKLPEEGVMLVNDHLESIFRSNMMSYLLGWEEKDGELGLAKGIIKFVDRYNLLEFGFDPSSLRRNYYRWKKDEKRLSFFTNQASNRVHNY